MRVFERRGARREVNVETSSIKAKWDADRECRRLLAEGWIRVGGEAVELASQPELIAALHANPEDIDTYAIFADWLSEHGDPWGLLMAVQIAIAQLPRHSRDSGLRRKELDREETRLRYLHAARIWGSLGEQIVDEATQRYASDLVEAEWFCGFVRSARIDEEVIDRFAALDVSQLLQALELRATEWKRTTLDLLAKTRWPELQSLKITTAVRARPLADARSIVPAFEAMPKLIELAVHGSHSTDGLCIALAANPIAARLERLDLTGCQFTDQGIRALASGHLRLRELRIGGIGPDDARSVLAGVAKTVTVLFGPLDYEDEEEE